MKRMPAGESPNQGPDWFDVSRLVKSIEREHRVLIVMEARPRKTSPDDCALVWEVSARRRSEDGSVYAVGARWSHFPHPDHRTTQGLLQKLLYLLQAHLDARAEQMDGAARQGG